jgi:lysophospholipase L1-like esterase
MTPVTHNYSRLAGQTVHWDTTDNKDWYFKNTQNIEARHRLAELGFLDTEIKYTYNSHGFRTAEFDQQFDVACFGCSFTMGTGVHGQDTWPEQLSALTGLHVANLGHAGSSNDTAVRFALHYLKLLRPKYAVWLQTDMHRIELMDDSVPLSLNIMASDTRNPCADDYFIKTWFTSPTNQQLNLQKNTLAFEQLCSLLDIESVIVPRDNSMDRPFPNGGARDLLHPGPDAYKKLAQQVAGLVVT